MLGNFPPFTTMQELNLDWILTKIKNILRFVPDDGAVGQILRRTPSGAEWSDEQGAGGSVTSVNGMQGAVVLTAADVGALPDSTTIPTNTSDLNNDSGFITASQAPVQSVNGQTGSVSLTIPDSTSDLVNDSGFVDAAGAAAAAPVQSVNGQTGSVSITIPDSTSDLVNDSGFVDAAGAAAAAPVQSVNGQTGAVVLTAADVGAAETNTSGTGYCKMPDGTLMCWGSYDGNTASTTQQGNLYVLVLNLNIVFPVEFYAKPSVTFSPSDDPYSIPVSGVAFTKTGITKIALARPNNSSITPHFSWIAIGRWKA